MSAERPSDRELLERWTSAPAPLLSLLHAFHDRDGYLSEDALRAIAEGLRRPLSDLYGTVTFYHHFARAPGGKAAPRVCDGPVCRLHGSRELLAALPGATPMPCSGRCDDPVPVLCGDQTLFALARCGDFALARSGADASSKPRQQPELQHRPSPLPVANPGGLEECCFADIRRPGRASLTGYLQSGGGRALAAVLAENAPAAVLARLEASGLAGRGGAGFPTARKWRAVREAPGAPKTIVCNADEGEPGCFKDRALLDHDPHAVLEGMLLAGFASGASRGFLYLRYEYPETLAILERALAELRAAGRVGARVLGSDFSFDIHLRRGAGAYICGEETSLLNSLEGAHPFPRNRPPYPVTHGFENLPTAVNNVETLASVPPILARGDAGAAWYAGLGRNGHKGTKIISLSGDVARPGNYEVPLGFPLATLVHEWAGGVPGGRSVQAVTMAGLSGGFLGASDLDVTLDEPALRKRGSFLGAGGIMVFDDSRDMVDMARQAMEFFAHESCGKCFPCRIGTQRLVERLSGSAGPRQAEAWRAEVRDIGRTMAAVSACGLGMAAPAITESLMARFPETLERALAERQR